MENIKLWEKNTPFYDPSFGQPETEMTPYIVPETLDENGNVKKTGCVIIAPGGGYTHTEPREGGPIAKMLNEVGISAFVLHYRFEPYDCNAIVADIKRAVRWVRYHADKYNIAPDKIATLGFSAGGHLSALAATLFDSGLEEGDEIDRMSCRPDAAAFCYAVLTMNLDYGDDISRRVFIGDVEHGGEIERLYSPYLNARDDMPPVFMWHTSADPIVPVENPLRMAKELSAKKIPFELHVFPEGAHGLDLAKDIPGTCQWPTLAQNWFKRQGF